MKMEEEKVCKVQTSFESLRSEGDAGHRYQQLYFVFLLFIADTCGCFVFRWNFEHSFQTQFDGDPNSIVFSELKEEFPTKVLAKYEIIHCLSTYVCSGTTIRYWSRQQVVDIAYRFVILTYFVRYLK